jgi:hypothetical protein
VLRYSVFVWVRVGAHRPRIPSYLDLLRAKVSSPPQANLRSLFSCAPCGSQGGRCPARPSLGACCTRALALLRDASGFLVLCLLTPLVRCPFDYVSPSFSALRGGVLLSLLLLFFARFPTPAAWCLHALPQTPGGGGSFVCIAGRFLFALPVVP